MKAKCASTCNTHLTTHLGKKRSNVEEAVTITVKERVKIGEVALEVEKVEVREEGEGKTETAAVAGVVLEGLKNAETIINLTELEVTAM